MKLIKALLVCLALQYININTAQETKENEVYQPASLQEISLTQVGPQLVDILMLSLTYNIDLTDVTLAHKEVLEWGLLFHQPFADFINTYTTPLKKLTLLEIAITCKNTQVVDYLLQAGADVNQYNKNGQTPLYYAVNENAIDVIPQLLAAKADVNKQNKQINNKTIDSFGFGTPLRQAIINFKMEIISMLLAAGADVDQADKFGETLLHILTAMRPGDSNNLVIIAQELVDAGANINAQDEYGNTPLHMASRFNSPSMVTWLLEAGADTTIVNKNGKTAFDVAVRPKIKNLYKKHYKSTKLNDNKL